MKTIAWLLIIILAISIFIPIIYIYQTWSRANTNAAKLDEFYFGITSGFNTTDETERLIDKVKNYTNLFIIDSWDIAQNEPMLNEICDYAANAGLRFIVYFDLISGTSPPLPPAYPWHKEWLTTAKTRWDDKFLGIHLHDELGGKQVDEHRYVQNASNYQDAANQFVSYIASFGSVQFSNNNSIPLFMSDYALCWWDYLGGYDTLFVELGWNISTVNQIALCRGAANLQRKDWGAIITWTYDQDPYLENGPEMYKDMLSAYNAGAKYVVVFDYAKNPANNATQDILQQQHLDAMKDFYTYVKTHPRSVYGYTTGQVAFVLPTNYGWGARRADEGLWGLWQPDDKTALIWTNMNKLSEKYGLKLDMIIDDARFNPYDKYSTIYFWNSTIT